MTRSLAPADVLDNPVWSSLTGAHTRFAVTHGRAARYDHHVAPFHALSDPDDPSAWDDLAQLVPVGSTVAVAASGGRARPGWEVAGSVAGVQLVDVALRAEEEPAAVRLSTADVPEILDLIDRTQPGVP